MINSTNILKVDRDKKDAQREAEEEVERERERRINNRAEMTPVNSCVFSISSRTCNDVTAGCSGQNEAQAVSK